MKLIMKNIKYFAYLNLIILLLTSCGSIKEGFSNPKKNSNDEFLVEKKSPLVMPPNFKKLPTPSTENKNINKKVDKIKDLITSNKNMNLKTNNNGLEDSILSKIKKN